MTNEATPHAVDQIIRERRTTKMLADAPLPAPANRERIEAIVAAAGWAPFHKPAAKTHRDKTGAIVPWRCHILDAATCRALREKRIAAGDETKIPRMLAAADALILVNWLPDPPKSESSTPFEGTLENMEHIAAASAGIQNILLAATARGVASYWSSGGALREPDVQQSLGIPGGQILLGAVFLFPTEAPGVEQAPGKLRDLRGPIDTWSQWVALV